MSSTAPIGVFDSGIGGLTVVRAIQALMPDETVFYLGDTARVPYGSKSPDVVRRYALNCSRFLVEQGAKAIVIACNTASAVAVESVAAHLDVPVIGVIEPGARFAAEHSANLRIGVIGTEGTVRSGRYGELLRHHAASAHIVSKACPLLVPLVEEGMSDHPATRMLAEEYLRPLLAEGIDTLVLGCTHYPLLEGLLQELAGPAVRVVNSASAVATRLAAVLAERDLSAPPLAETRAEHRYFATDASERFQRVGQAFLGAAIGKVEWVDL